LSGIQFGQANTITLYGQKRAEQTLSIDAILLTEGVTSIREAVRAGLRRGAAAGLADCRGPSLRAPAARVAGLARLGSADARDLRGATAAGSAGAAFVDFAVDSLTQTLRPED
jgi:hypothetical protein